MVQAKRAAAVVFGIAAVVVLIELVLYSTRSVGIPGAGTVLDRIRLPSATNHRIQPVQQPSNAIPESPYTSRLEGSSPAPDRNFILSLHYAEQLSNAVQHFISFQNMAALYFHMTGVRPLVSGSRVYGLRSIFPTSSVQMEDLFDLTDVEQRLSGCLHNGDVDSKVESTSPKMLRSVEEFVLHSHREIILVYIADHFGAFNYLRGPLSGDSFNSFDKSLQLGPSIATECTAEINKTWAGSNPIHAVESLLNAELGYYNQSKLEQFHIIKSYCINRKIDSTVEKLRDIILGNETRINASILFVTWQGHHIGSTFTHLTKCRVTHFPVSQLVLNTTRVLLESLHVAKPFISVHLRLEWVFGREKNNYITTVCCLNRLAELIDVVAEKHKLKNSRILLIKDFSAFGTDSCRVGKYTINRDICMNRTDKAMTILKQILSFPFTTVEFNSTNFKNAPQNTGFSSLVESQVLTEGAVLITMGGGNFQKTIRDRFIEKHGSAAGTEKHYGVCPDILQAVTLQSQSCD